MEKCIGCELCAGVCPAKCIYVRGADNDPDDPTSPGERFGFVYEINYLRCIHCDLCVEACPTEAITESKLFEFSFTNRQDAIYTKSRAASSTTTASRSRCRGRTGARARTLHTSGWMRATSPSGDADFVGEVGWSGELGYGVRARRASPEPSTRRPRRRRRARSDGAVRLHRRRRRWSSVGAVGVVVRSHPVHAALSLVLTLFGVAVLFVAQDAHFLAAVQVIVYAGAIVVLFLFVIMLLGVDRAEDLRIEPIKVQRPLAVIVGVGLVGIIGAAIVAGPRHARRSAATGIATADQLGARRQHRQLASDLFSNHVFAFELDVGAAGDRGRRHRAARPPPGKQRRSPTSAPKRARARDARRDRTDADLVPAAGGTAVRDRRGRA